MLFDKDIRRVCALCENAAVIDGDTVICRRKGPMDATASCRRFKYDPLLRQPQRPAALKKYTQKDFEL